MRRNLLWSSRGGYLNSVGPFQTSSHRYRISTERLPEGLAFGDSFRGSGHGKIQLRYINDGSFGTIHFHNGRDTGRNKWIETVLLIDKHNASLLKPAQTQANIQRVTLPGAHSPSGQTATQGCAQCVLFLQNAVRLPPM